MKTLQNKCAWKDISEVQVLAEGKLGECRICDGYNKTCHAYYSTAEKAEKIIKLKRRELFYGNYKR